jgi:integrase
LGFFAAESGGDRSPGKITLGECAALWLARHEQMRLSFFQARQVLNRLIARHGRDPIDAVGHRELDRWLQSLNDEGLAPVTVHNHWRITRRFFNFSRDFLEVITKNPFAKLTEPRLEHQDPEVLTPEQMRACLEAAVARDEDPLCASRQRLVPSGANQALSTGEGVFVKTPAGEYELIGSVNKRGGLPIRYEEED